MSFAKIVFGILMVLITTVFIGRAVFDLPDLTDRQDETAIPVSELTLLGAHAIADMSSHPGLTGVSALAEGKDALSSRLTLIENAQSSIDAQYYIWHDDTSGILLLDALARAAERGVRVRLLLDDNGIHGLDPLLAALNARKNFHIRLFNPSTIRSPKYAGYAIDFFRMNRRMHNKSLIADGAAAILGGRNIGDEYFAIGNSFYVDMDALAVGKVVPEISAIFDQYWNSGSVFELESIVAGNGDIDAFQQRVEDVHTSQDAKDFTDELTANSAAKYIARNMSLEWTDVNHVADDPIKGEGKAKKEHLMIHRLGEIIGDVEKRLDLVSAYFIPGKSGVDYFTALRDQGVDVNILTNALDTTDVLLVHAGYTKYRHDLLADGINLYEMKLRGERARTPDQQTHMFGLSGAALHAKTFAIDHERAFIGSFNFDPRSAQLNCEMGILIKSPSMAKAVSKIFDGPIREVSYKPELTADADLIWHETDSEGNVSLLDHEPGSTRRQQVLLKIIGFFPIEWML